MAPTFKNMTEDAKSEAILDLVKGRTTPELEKEILALATEDETVAAEIEYLKALESSLTKPLQSEHVDEVTWAGLSKAIDAEENKSAAPRAANDNTRMWRYIAAALALVVVGQATFVTQQNGEEPTQPGYSTVGEQQTGAVLQITFVGTANEAAIRELLQKTSGTIVDGPGALGVYTVKFADDAALQNAKATLMAEPEIIENIFTK